MFHSDGYTENIQNLLENREISAKSHLNSILVKNAYSKEESGLRKEVFDQIDQIFEADCSNQERYNQNLDEIVRELDQEKYREFIDATMEYRGDQE